MNEPLDNLLEQLCSGDMAAVEQVFLAYEPYLRQAVRRHLSASLRTKFDSADIVLSTWADVLRGFREVGWRFIDADHLRGFLFIATRNRLIDRIRQQQGAAGAKNPSAKATGSTPCHLRSRAPARSPRRVNCGNGSWPIALPNTARFWGSGGKGIPWPRSPSRPVCTRTVSAASSAPSPGNWPSSKCRRSRRRRGDPPQ